jgi:hypothetical protein
VGEYPGIGGRMKSERVGASNRNRWADHPGIRRRLPARFSGRCCLHQALSSATKGSARGHAV